jgi:hypothetical protein
VWTTITKLKACSVHNKSRHKIRSAEIFSSCTENGVFFSAAICKKNTIFGAARKIFDPSYFVTALG